MAGNVIDGFLSAADFVGFFIRDLYFELFFHCHDHLDGVQTIQPQVLLERGFRRDLDHSQDGKA